MDTQIATTNGGELHAVSTVRSEADAERFQNTMHLQGYQVARLNAAEAAVRFARTPDMFKISDSFDIPPEPVQPFDTLPKGSPAASRADAPADSGQLGLW